MTTAGVVVFNLLLSGVLAFAMSVLCSSVALRVLRVPPGRAHLAIAALPFAKLLWDLGRGIPDEAFLWQRAQGAVREVGSLKVEFAWEWCFVHIDLALDALVHGAHHPDSAANLLAAWLAERAGAWLPGLLAFALLAGACFRLGVRAQAWLCASRAAKTLRNQPPVDVRWLGRSAVPIFLSEATGTPFTGGLLSVFICVPRKLWHCLSPEELEAALAHELGHLEQRHLWLCLLTGVLADLFWFAPGMASARRQLLSAVELSADRAAVVRGHSPAALASALLRVAEQAAGSSLPFAKATCAAARGSISLRLRVLLGEQAAPRWVVRYRLGRVLVALSLLATALSTVVLGY